MAYYGAETGYPSQPPFQEGLRSPHSPGTLIAIGGEADSTVLEHVVKSSTGGKVHIATLAHPRPEFSFDYNSSIMTQFDASTNHVKDSAELAATLDRIGTDSVVYFGGGDQIDLVGVPRSGMSEAALEYLKREREGKLPTGMSQTARDQLRQAHRRGVTIAGSSAGAMMMGDVTIWRGEIIEGIGLIQGVTFDTHFDTSERLTRLRRAVRQRGVVGFGIDEATAAVVVEGSKGKEVSVVGKGRVHVVHQGMETDLVAGDLFHVGRREVLRRLPYSRAA